MNGDHKGKLQPREALTGAIPGHVAQVEAQQVVQGIKATTSDTYRWEDNTDPGILARVWDGTTTVFSVNVNGLVAASQLQFTGFADEPDSTPAVSISGDGTTTAVLTIDGPVVAGGSAGGPLVQLYSDPTDGRITLGADTYIFLNTPTTTVGGALAFGGVGGDTNLYRSAANVLKTDDQLIAADGLTGKYVSAAGRVNGADGDFTVAPGNGTAYTVRNSTDGKVYWTARANGAWKAIELV